jgi:hypothetical protein
MANMREQAIELSQKRVIADESEEFIGGWTFLTPHVPDTVRAAALEEAVLLLTDRALYLCRFDWNLDKVSSFERVDLAHIRKIKFGTYITSTMSAAQVDDMRNVGLVIEYKPGNTDITRVNTRSISSMASTPKPHNPDGTAAPAEDTNIQQQQQQSSQPGTAASALTNIAGFLTRKPQVIPPRKIALKALYSQTSIADPAAVATTAATKSAQHHPGATTRLTEIQQVVVIAAEIERLALASRKPRFATEKNKKSNETAGLIEKGDIISLAEAKRNTGLLEQLGHSIKKFVWA